MFASPAGDAGVVAASEDVGDGEVTEGGGAGILGVFEEVLGEGFVDGGVSVAEDTRTQAGDCVEDDEGGGFAAAEDVVTDGDFFVDEEITDASVDAFVAATDEHEVVVLGEPPDGCLVEGVALRGHEDAEGALPELGFDGFDAVSDGFGFHDHASAAAVGGVIGGAVAVFGVLADVVEGDIEHARGGGAFEDGGLERGRKKLRKKS